MGLAHDVGRGIITLIVMAWRVSGRAVMEHHSPLLSNNNHNNNNHNHNKKPARAINVFHILVKKIRLSLLLLTLPTRTTSRLAIRRKIEPFLPASPKPAAKDASHVLYETVEGAYRMFTSHPVVGYMMRIYPVLTLAHRPPSFKIPHHPLQARNQADSLGRADLVS